MSADMLAAALEFAARGWLVLPIRALGKTPLTDRGFKDATTDPTAIRVWWEKWPSANIAVATGSNSVIAVDIDGDAGEKSLSALIAQYGPLPETLESRTGRGRHLFYVASGSTIRNDTGRKLGPGIDVRGAGGYVIMPPSVHESGRQYQWIRTVSPVPLPGWLLKKLSVTLNAKNNDDGHARIAAGQRNNTLASLAGTMRKRGMSQAAILAALQEHNRECCDPPLPEREVRAIAESVGRYPISASTTGTPADTEKSAASRFQGDRASVAFDSAAKVSVSDRLTEAGAAERFARLHGGDLRFDHRRGQWLIWNVHRWRRDVDGAITRMALEFARRWQHEALKIEDLQKREAALKASLRLERRDALNSMLGLAKDLKPIADPGDSWDLDPHLLGVPNGVVDLRTGDLRAGRREDKISLSASIAYDPHARSQLWERTLKAVLVDDELICFFQAAAGYSATGDTSLDSWFLGCGEGRNGKGTTAHPIRQALGDYALELPASVFDLKTERAPFELARLPGRRLVMSSESGDTIRLNHDRIKQLSGGDPMSVANKYERAFEFQPASKLWLFCNRKPRVTDDTVAFWSRVFLLPFVVSFAGREDHTLRPKLTQDPTHQAAILAWIVRGAVGYLSNGLGKPPETVIEATKAYRDDQDLLGPFLEQACALEATSETGASDLYEHYIKWADRQHLTTKERLTATMFGRTLSGRFKNRKERITGVKLYLGISMRELN
jgi:putative DNA primase/helicase